MLFSLDSLGLVNTRYSYVLFSSSYITLSSIRIFLLLYTNRSSWYAILCELPPRQRPGGGLHGTVGGRTGV